MPVDIVPPQRARLRETACGTDLSHEWRRRCPGIKYLRFSRGTSLPTWDGAWVQPWQVGDLPHQICPRGFFLGNQGTASDPIISRKALTLALGNWPNPQ